MLVMPTGTAAMHAKWDSASMASPHLPPYKIERPAYSTPPPVENTPANNDCRMVDLRGAQVASFRIGREEYICLPQAFDLFLKNLVGGLHTVYTKLKRLNIHPVVCNVEQVRILRGHGAIQPGVNRCKLITRKDFEVLYQDCTTASRPGRPPKRYPMNPPADFMSYHPGIRSNNAAANPLVGQADFSSYHKRMRMDHGMDNSQNERKGSRSPEKDDDKNHSSASILSGDFQNNTSANLAYLQALRHQYQQAAASGLHNGLDPQQINPFNQLMMMQHPALFSSTIPPTSIAMLNHINQIAQSHAAGGSVSSAMAAAAAQLVASGNALHSHANNNAQESRQLSNARENHKDSDGEEATGADKCYNRAGAALNNGISSDGRTSPSSGADSPHEHRTGNCSDGSAAAHSFDSRRSPKLSPALKNCDNILSSDGLRQKSSDIDLPADDDAGVQLSSSMSSMQTLLTNIQGLLKVAADNANLQEKHASFEIAELKLKLNQERQLRESAERKLEGFERAKAETETELHQEKKENQRLQSKIVSMQRLIGHDVNNNVNESNAAQQQPSPHASTPSPRASHESQGNNSPPPTSGASPVTSYPPANTFDASVFSARIAAVEASGNQQTSPAASPDRLTASSSASNTNNSNNYSSGEQTSPDYVRRNILPDGRTPDIAIDLGMARQDRAEHLALQDARLFFKNSLLYQPSASQ